jgi:hypothetical protein
LAGPPTTTSVLFVCQKHVNVSAMCPRAGL